MSLSETSWSKSSPEQLRYDQALSLIRAAWFPPQSQIASDLGCQARDSNPLGSVDHFGSVPKPVCLDISKRSLEFHATLFLEFERKFGNSKNAFCHAARQCQANSITSQTKFKEPVHMR